MKFNYFLYQVFIFVLTYQNCLAQKEERRLYQCNYLFSINYDTTNASKILTENYTLEIGKTSTKYYSSDRYHQDSILLAEAKKSGFVGPPNSRRYNSEVIYFDLAQKNMFTSSNPVIGNFVMRRSYPNLTWKLTNEKSKILGYNAYKASTEINGKKYTCWYTLDIPIQSGPWKLNGLPGLILKAEDETGRIKFIIKGFKNTPNSTNKIFWNTDQKMISWNEYLRLIYFLRDDPRGFIMHRYPGTTNVSSSKGFKPSKHIILEVPTAANFRIEDLKFLIKE